MLALRGVDGVSCEDVGSAIIGAFSGDIGEFSGGIGASHRVIGDFFGGIAVLPANFGKR